MENVFLVYEIVYPHLDIS